MRASRTSQPVPGSTIRSLFVATLIAVSLGAVPAHAAPVTVDFGLAAGAYAPTGAACQVSVPSGANGVVVLDAAVAKGCILSYDTTTFAGFGTFVRCVDEVCGEEASGFFLTYWKLYVNGRPATAGVDAFRATAGSSLVLSYTTWAGCLASDDDPLC